MRHKGLEAYSVLSVISIILTAAVVALKLLEGVLRGGTKG